MPLPMGPTGQLLSIKKISADEKTRRHLCTLGVLPGAEVTLISASGGDVVIGIKDGRLALNKSLASRIFI